jgi:hypothetical protein
MKKLKFTFKNAAGEELAGLLNFLKILKRLRC